MNLVDFVGRPAWPAAEVAALPGRGKGSLLRDWAVHLERHRGRAAVDEARAATGLGADVLPDRPAKDAWIRVAHQALLARYAADRWFGGDLLALEPVLRADALHGRDGWLDRLLRKAISPRRVLAQGARIHAALYDLGRASVAVDKAHLRITWEGARFMAEPTWGALQTFAIRGLCAATDTPEPRIEAWPGEAGLVMDVVF